MSFEEDIQQHLATSRHEKTQRDRAVEMSLQLALDALDRLQKKCAEGATFLASHRVPTSPLIEESLKEPLWSATKKVQETLGRGWKIPHSDLVILEDGTLWQSALRSYKSTLLQRSGRYDFDAIRRLVTAGQAATTPLGDNQLGFPLMLWDAMHGFYSHNADAGVVMLPNHSDLPQSDLERHVSSGVMQLAGKHA